LKALKANIGKSFGPSKEFLVTQEIIDQFASATQDLDPLHIDPKWAAENGPFPSTISFGFLTMSFITAMAHDVLQYEREERDGSSGFPLNYGFNKMRLIAPVPVNSKIFGIFTIKDVVERKPGQILQTYEVVVHIKGVEKPALVGEWLALWVNS
tara:strand:+ start:8161 stop:8622 length:462 start_codon:yes stop_codon:yes gene_type:complete